jgi:KDO2-lipid IV(A) lauroyltransferase
VASPTAELYHPRYWPTWLLLGIAKLITLLPLPAQLWLGRRLGRLFMRFSKRRRHITEVNLRLCFPELDDVQRRDLLVRTFESQGMGLMETIAAWLMPPKRLLPLAVIHDAELLENAQRKGKAVLLLGAHYTTLDISGTLFGNFFAIDVIYRRQKNPVINYFMTRGREKYLQGGRSIPQDDMRSVYRSLSNKRVLWYPPDQDYGAKHSVFAPFFGVPAAVIKAPTRMARKSKAEVLACWYYRSEDGKYHIAFGPIEGFTGTDYEADALAINRQLEKVIREHPDQYMWVHRRFKSRPPGMDSVY